MVGTLPTTVLNKLQRSWRTAAEASFAKDDVGSTTLGGPLMMTAIFLIALGVVWLLRRPRR